MRPFRWVIAGCSIYVGLAVLCLAPTALRADCNCDCQRANVSNQLSQRIQEQQDMLALGQAFQSKARFDVGELQSDRNEVYDLLLNKAEVKEREALTQCQ